MSIEANKQVSNFGRQGLGSLTRGLHKAALSTQELLVSQHINFLLRFFDKKDGRLFAKVAYVKLNQTHWIPVPLISLASPQSLHLNKMKVALQVKIEESEVRNFEIGKEKHLGLKVNISPNKIETRKNSNGFKTGRSDLTDIQLEFKTEDPPEAIMKIIDYFNNLVEPRKLEESEVPTLASITD